MNSFKEGLKGVAPKMDKTYYEEVVSRISQSFGTGETKDVTKFFQYNWMPFVMAALIGFKYKCRKELPSDPGKIKKDTFKFAQIFSGDAQLVNALLVYVISIEGPEVLNDRPKVVKCIEEHANGGLEILYEKINKGELLSIQGFLDFANEFISDTNESKGNN